MNNLHTFEYEMQATKVNEICIVRGRFLIEATGAHTTGNFFLCIKPVADLCRKLIVYLIIN